MNALPEMRKVFPARLCFTNHHLRALAFALVAMLGLVACLSGKPETLTPQPGEAITVYPDAGGELVSDDQRVIVRFEPGTVSHPTTFSITRIPQANYPDQILLQSDVYQIEPSRSLDADVSVTVDLNGLEGRGFTLTQLYTQNALALRELLPAKAPLYIASEETTVEDVQGSPHRVLKTTTRQLGAIGVFVHDCFVMCRKSVECSSWPDDPNLTSKQEIARCMENYGCPADIETMNGERAQAQFQCALTHSCSDAFGCCTDNPPCDGGPTDGDTSDGDVADGDTPDGDVTDGDTTDGDTTDGDTTDGDTDLDDDQTDGDTDQSHDFSPRPCMGPDNCAGDTCAYSDILTLDNGYCLAMSADPVLLYANSSPGVWNPVDAATLPLTDCVGDPAQSGLSGDSIFDLRITLDNWWPISNAEGIQVDIFSEFNLDAAVLSKQMDANGQANFEDANLADEWFVVRLSRESENAADRVVPTWHWGNFITKADASTANLNQQPVVVKVMPIDGNRYTVFAQALGVSGGVPQGHGMLIGQVGDCRAVPYAIANASVGFREASPLVMGYFDDQTAFPTPDETRVGTNKNGLFVAVDLPPADILTAFAFGTVKYEVTETLELLGMSNVGHLRLQADSVSVVRFNRFR